MLVLHCLWGNTVNQFWLLHSIEPVSFSVSVLDSILPAFIIWIRGTTSAWHLQKWAENQSGVPFPVKSMLFFSILLGLFLYLGGSYGINCTTAVTIRNPVISLQGRWCKFILLVSVFPHHSLQCQVDKLHTNFTVIRCSDISKSIPEDLIKA